MTFLDQAEQTAREYIEKIILPSEPLDPLWNRENSIFRKEPKWNYMDSCIIRAILMTDEEKYAPYAVKFIDSYVAPDGNIPTYRASDFNLDNVCGGMNLLTLHRLTGDEKYRTAYETIYREQLKNQPRLSCGCFWHKLIYPRQMWLDGTYMALPFMASYGMKTGEKAVVEDALSQAAQVRRLMCDSTTGLYFHGYNESRDMKWADPETGLSRELWLRSNGWLCAGIADLYEITGDKCCGEMLRELTDALTACLTEENMLLQLPARKELAGNYPETSGTLLYAYGALKGYSLGVCSEDAKKGGLSALSAVTEKYITHRDGIPVLSNICLMAGLGGERERDGSAEYYLSERIVENDAKGIAPYIMAASLSSEFGVRSSELCGL